MKVSFDLDGVLYDRIDFFSSLLWALKNNGHFIGVLSGHSQESEPRVREKLLKLGYPEIDFYFGRTPEYMQKNGAVRKSDLIKLESIDMHFDDYDYNHPTTCKIFAASGVENRIARIKSTKECEGWYWLNGLLVRQTED